ncbi:MAG TPA: hypothetical protein V6D29_03800 [Leptolyngbyaceae cyanobacterium]
MDTSENPVILFYLLISQIYSLISRSQGIVDQSSITVTAVPVGNEDAAIAIANTGRVSLKVFNSSQVNSLLLTPANQATINNSVYEVPPRSTWECPGADAQLAWRAIRAVATVEAAHVMQGYKAA